MHQLKHETGQRRADPALSPKDDLQRIAIKYRYQT